RGTGPGALGREPVAGYPPARGLAAPGVGGGPAAELEPTALDEGAALAPATEPEGLDPGEGEEAEAVVELRGVHVGGREVRPRPQLRPGVTRRHGGQVFPLIPARPRAHGRPDGVDADWGMRQVARDVRSRDDHRGRAVTRRVAVVEPERPADEPGIEVLRQRERLAIDRVRVERGVLAPRERDGGELLAG